MSRRKQSLERRKKRGHITPFGTMLPKRPFHNKANTSERKGVHSRRVNEEKKILYARFYKGIEKAQKRNV